MPNIIKQEATFGSSAGAHVPYSSTTKIPLYLSKQSSGHEPNVRAEPQELRQELVADLAFGVPLCALPRVGQWRRDRERPRENRG